MSDPWIWFNVITFKRETFMNYESNAKKVKFCVSKTMAWDLAEMIAYKAAYECLNMGYHD